MLHSNIVSDEETEVIEIEPKLSYDDLQKAYDELLDDSQTLASHYAFLKKNFAKIVPWAWKPQEWEREVGAWKNWAFKIKHPSSEGCKCLKNWSFWICLEHIFWYFWTLENN